MEPTKKTYRPSGLPALDQCPQYECDSIERDFASAGTRRHSALSEVLDPGILTSETLHTLQEHEQDAVAWAAEYVEMTRAEDPLILEVGIEIDTGRNQLKGTPDVTDNAANVWDLKWRYRAYGPQLASYALGIMDDNFLDKITVHVLYGEQMRAVKYSLTIEDARIEVDRVIDKAEAGGPPSPCDYCNWCSKTATCQPYIDRTNMIVANREDWQLDSFHPSDLESAEGMAKALTLAKMMGDWIASVEYHAKKFGIENGGLPGFKLTPRKGKPSFTNLAKVCQLSGLDDDEFLKACSPSFTALKGLYVTKFRSRYTSAAAAEKDLVKKLQQVTSRAADTLYLRKENPQKTPTQKENK